jgi:fermentation-respiration switch protein FrsA (DUF1100 family)
MTIIPKKLMLIIFRFIFPAALIISSLILFLRYIETRTLFYPIKEISFLPDQANLEFQDVFFKTNDFLKLNGWFIPCKNSEYTVLFCHGNAGNISHRIEKLRLFHTLGCNVFIFDYRGYGLSRGTPSEAGLYKDAQAAYKYLLSQGILESRIIGYGESIGGSVIVDLAWRQKLKAIILDSSFSSVKDMIKYTYPLIPYWVFSSRFDSERKIKSLKIPKLIIHSLNDEIVPYQLGKKLYAAASEPKDFLQIRGGHNSNFYESEGLMREKIGDFIKKLGGDD